MTIQKITDLEAWQEARKLCQGIYIIIKNYPRIEEYNIKKHLRESARGVMANTAEGFGRYFYKESLKFYNIALACLEEVRSDLYLSFDLKYISQPLLNKFLKQIDNVQRKLNGLVANTAKRTKIK